MTIGFDPSQMPAGLHLPGTIGAKPAAQRLMEAVTTTPFRDTFIQQIQPPAAAKPSSSSPANLVGDFVRAVSAKEQAATEMRNAFLAGESVNLHQTMIASQEASLSFSLMVELRNKVMESYQELMRIQI